MNVPPSGEGSTGCAGDGIQSAGRIQANDWLTLAMGIAEQDHETVLVRRSLASQIAQLVRSDILYGRLRPGERVSQQQLAAAYGTSRIPVRDALRELTQEGFLVSGPAGQVVVSRVTADDVTDAFAILATALGCAARRAAGRASADD